MDIKLTLLNASNISYYNQTQITIDFETYIKGVVASEIGNAHIEACRAQAVAARTFAFNKISNGKQLTDQSSKDQCFRAARISNSYATALAAVDDTEGEVLYYNDKLISSCPYSHSNGGRVRSSKEVWGGDRPWL